MESLLTLEKLKGRIPNIKLVLAGLGEKRYEEQLRSYARKKKLEKNIVFTGHVSRKIVRDLYKACDVALFPTKAQGGWLSPFEALCSGRPIIVSRSLTSSDIIKRNGLGIVTDDFAGAVLEISRNRGKYDAMADRGRLWVRKNLTWDRFCGKMVKLFEKASSQRS